LVKRIKVKRSAGARLGITVEEFSALLVACKKGKNEQSNIRDYTIVTLMYSCLLRRSEVSEFVWKDLEREGGRSILKLPLTKGGANDFVPIPQEMIQQLNCYFLEMGGAATWLAYYDKPLSECPVFFALDRAHRGNKLSGHGINEIIKKRAKIAGIQSITAHILRHTAITHLLIDGEPLADVQILARHSDPKQTSQYAMLLRRINNSTGRTLAERI